jgi:hypothetical protein
MISWWTVLPLAIVAWAFWAVLSRFLVDIGISLRSDLAVAPGARQDVDDYLRRGFAQVAASDVATGGHETIFSYLLSADGRTYAVATDKVRCVASAFGERVMVSISHAATPVPPLELRQRVVTGGVDELLGAHEAALAVLAGHGLQPDPLRPERVAPFSIWIDRVSMDHLVGHKAEFGLTMLWRMLSLPPLNASLIKADRRTAARIERWKASAIPTAKSSFEGNFRARGRGH